MIAFNTIYGVICIAWMALYAPEWFAEIKKLRLKPNTTIEKPFHLQYGLWVGVGMGVILTAYSCGINPLLTGLAACIAVPFLWKLRSPIR